MAAAALSLFHPLIRQWFIEKVGHPTDIQEKAWTEIAEGKHVLVTAPTGCGKTLAAFLWGMNRLITGTWPRGKVRVLYISPLKALNNDVRQNLLKPLSELRELFSCATEPFPEISVLTRSGDTPGEERRKMFRRPPEILITTPESLNLLLTSRSGRSMLDGIATVILDEIHAVVGTKRGTHLITAVERLVLLSGEFQRIALSATVNPPGRVAEFVAGFRKTGEGKDSFYEKRPIVIVQSRQAKLYEIKVSFPSDAREKMVDGSWWSALIDSFKETIQNHRSTLFFANSRRTTEKVVRMINETSDIELAYAHHGSLSREIRMAIERKLKRGELKAIVATNSLELGIDIGVLDQVVLIQTPRAVSSALQRVGRSGHSVGEASKGTIYPVHGRDFVDAAVMARALLAQDIEEVRPIDSPLDVLAQVVLSMTAMEVWDIDGLYSFLKTMYPFRNLSKKLFDIVLEMLGGRYADTRLRELKARVSIDRIDNTVRAHAGTPYLIYTSGGTIPERGYFDLRLKDTRAKIGELDEEFVWERSIGETFTLGSQLWRIEKITHNDVEVVPARSATGIFPFWKAEELNRDFHLSEKIGLFLEHANQRLDQPDFKQELMSNHAMDEAAADELISFLKLQKEASGQGLPNRHRILIEYVEEPAGGGEFKQAIMHTFWGGKVNRPFGLALSQAWEEREHTPLQVTEADDALFLMLPREAKTDEILGLLTSENVESFLRKKLEQTGFFGARFRENAERALLLPKSSFKRRMPLWLIRLRAKELLEAIRQYEDFPMMIETWRTCLEDEFDLENLKMVLDEVRDRAIEISETVTRSASPFASHLVWKQTNTYMYDDDTPLTPKESGLRPDLIKELLFSSHLRPKIPSEVIAVLDGKLKRTASGYAPDSGLELLDWVKERMLIPEPEWKELASAIHKDSDTDAAEWLRSNSKKLLWLTWPGVQYPLLSSIESVPKVLVAFRLLLDDLAITPVSSGEDAQGLRRRIKSYLRERASIGEEYDLSAFLSSWFASYGPIEKEGVHQLLGITPERLDEAIEPLIEAGDLVMDRIREGSAEIELCDAGNLEMLLRMARRFRRPSFQALPVEKLPLFLAAFQGITPRGESLDDLQARLEQLFGWPAPVGAWEGYLLPARMARYRSDWIDRLISDTDLIWFGCGERKIGLAFSQDLELFHPSAEQTGNDDELMHLIPDRRGRYSFLEISEFAHLDTAHATDLLWKEAWKGHVTSDSFRTIRNGVLAGFAARAFGDEARLASRRFGFNRWKVSRPMEGNWLRIDAPVRESDILEEEELVKDRIRQLLKRYGIVFRELISSELLPLQWRAVFRSLRLMELSGEVLSGYFFEAVPGPQFISHEAFRMIQGPFPEDAVFWINAADPASLCGLGIDPLDGLPPRVPSSFLVYQGSRLVMIAKRQGKSLDLFVPHDDARLAEYFGLFKDLLSREFSPLQKVTIETINNEPALRSPYADALKVFGFRSARNALELWKEY